jgi:hypothetical protein
MGRLEMRETFMVGKLTQRGTAMWVVKGRKPSPIPGPWSLKALVRPAPARSPLPFRDGTVVH